jgi:hypothetical protein
VDVDHFQLFVNAINDARLAITAGNIVDLSSLAAKFGFVQLMREIDIHDPRFSVARWATWDGEDVRKLILTLPDTSLPGRDEIQILNLTRSLEERAAHRKAEVHPAPDSTVGDRPRISLARRNETETKIEGEMIETLPELKSKSQARIDALTTGRQHFMKENDKLRVVGRAAKHEDAKINNDDQILLEERKRLISMNTKLRSDAQNLRDFSANFQAKIDALRTERQNFVKHNAK